MERLRSPILFLVLVLLPCALCFSGWRYWWPLQLFLQVTLCLVGLYPACWRLPALMTLSLILFFNFSWFDFSPKVPADCMRQIDHFSGIVETDRNDPVGNLRLIKVEIRCRKTFQRWPSAELKAAPSSLSRYGWFRKGDRIALRKITFTRRDRFALDIHPTSKVRITNISYQERILSRSPVLIYIQKKARYFLSPFALSIYKALITADRSSLTPETKAQIRNLGITHLFAISGMHIGILYLWFTLVIRWLISFPGFWIEKGAGVVLTDLFAIVSIFLILKGIGMPISARRAFIMLAWWGVMRHLLGWQPLWFILLGTAVVILLDSPIAVGQKSFQLSFLSVAGIVQILPFLPRRSRQDSTAYILLKLLLASFVVSSWLFILTMPLVSTLADEFSLITAVNNVVHIYYLSFVFLPFALLVALITLLGYPWSGLPIEFYLYSLLNILGRLWEEMLHLNTAVNRYFLFNHLDSWHFALILGWITLFGMPFILRWYLQRSRKK